MAAHASPTMTSVVAVNTSSPQILSPYQSFLHVPPHSSPYLPTLPLSPPPDASADLQACIDIHAVTGALKLYLRELPVPLITFDAYDLTLIAAGRLTNHTPVCS